MYYFIGSINAKRGDTHDFVRCIKDNIEADTQLVMCILPNDRKDRYDSIKKMCCVENAGWSGNALLQVMLVFRVILLQIN